MRTLIPKEMGFHPLSHFLVAVCEMLLGLALSATVGSAQSFSSSPPAIDPAYAGSYSAVDIGAPPVSGDIGALTFKDANTLYIDVNTYSSSAEIDAFTVTRGAGQHITGFSGVGTKIANAPYCDGGLQFGLNGVLFYTGFGPNQLGQIKPGSTSPDKVTVLTPLGVSPSVGSLAFVPPSFPGAGNLKLISWNAETWYSTYLSPDGSGTFNVASVASPATPLPAINWEGMAFIEAGQPLFTVNSVLINADLSEAVYAFQLDANGNPITSTQKHFMNVSDPVGMTVDPVTGDILITTEQGPLAHHIAIVQGFMPPVQSPTPTVTTSKPVYNPGETVVVNFSNAVGKAREWIGLFNAGTSNTSYLRWFYTDGTQTGTAGLINGSVSFPAGFSTPGNYEARLFFDNSSAMEAAVSFSVQTGPPNQATNPNPSVNATGVTLTPTLTWTAGLGAASHQVYFGTNPNPGPSELKGSQSGNSFSPGTLAIQTAYYWRIDETNTQGTTTGVVWKFTTGSGPPAVTTSKASYTQGEPITVNFSNAAGNARDWIGLFVAGAANTSYLQWSYTDGTQTGTAGISTGSVTFPNGLPNTGNYEARLLFNGSYTTQASVSFSVQSGPPTQATNPNPISSSIGVSLNPTLSWTSGAAATSHRVYFGTNPAPGAGDFKGSQTSTAYGPGALTAQTTYYWRIDEVNAQGTTPGVVWNFTTGSPPTITTNKATYSPGEPITVTFTNASGNSHDWIGLFAAGAANTAYLNWFYTDGTQSGTAGIINGSVTFPNGLPSLGNYEARLLFNGSYTSQASAAFSVQNGPQAKDPNPASATTGVNLTPTLTWTAGTGATSHNVYFGTNPTPGGAELKGTQSGTTYSPGVLTVQTAYYWRIDEVNGQGTASGTVWSFTTAATATTPTVAVSKGAYSPGAPIVITIGNASGNSRDWIGLYALGAADTAYLQWLYTDGTQVGTAGIINGTVTFPNGLPNAGNYEARLFFNGSYVRQASAPFTVQAGSP